MNSQLTSNAEALRLFFTEDIYLVKDENQITAIEPVAVRVTKGQEAANLPQLTSVVEEPKPVLKKAFNFEFLGKNQKGILILVNDSTNKVSSVQGTELLRKLVKAIELTNNDFALVNYANYPDAKFEDLVDFFNCQVLLSFGVNTQQLGLAEQVMHQLYNQGEKRLIFTKNLHDLDSDQLSKKTLWTSLQQLK